MTLEVQYEKEDFVGSAGSNYGICYIWSSYGFSRSGSSSYDVCKLELVGSGMGMVAW